jgi:hypothetical protein
MSFFMVVFKVIPYIVPFLKEMILGKKTWRQAFKENRIKTILTFLMAISVAFNVILTARIGTLAFRYLELSRANEELEKKYLLLEKSKTGIESSARHPVVNNTEIVGEMKKDQPPATPAKPASSTQSHDAKLAVDVIADLERIRKREAVER